MTRAGIVTVAGKPNAGKSTLLNRLVGEKLSIISPKPQSTRDRVVGIRTRDDVQMVLLDTPGLLEPTYALQTAMRATALRALADADVIVHLVDAAEETPTSLQEAAGLSSAPKAETLLVLNKIDSLSANRLAALRSEFPDAFFISARQGDGVLELEHALAARLPESPFLYPDDEISTQSVRFFCAELVRETALEQLQDEVPYSIACEIEEYREGAKPVYIRAVLYVERESQKGILIGDKGARVRDIGKAARAKIEHFIGSSVYLDLWVKVLPNWRRSANSLARFGYQLPPTRERDST